MAVGYYTSAFGVQQTLTEHWDGNSWRIVYSPSNGSGNAHLSSVAALLSNDVWSVGYYTDSNSSQKTLMLRWDGAQWNIVPSPSTDSTYNVLTGVASVTSDDVWAVGYHTDGGASLRQTLTLHWDGAQWSIIPSPNFGEGHNALLGVSATPVGDVWAVGFTQITLGGGHTLTLHWNGTAWDRIPSPDGGPYTEDILYSVVALTVGDVWAVGESFRPSNTWYTLVEHWDGNQWSVVPSPSSEGIRNVLNGVSASAPDDVWAVGSRLVQTLTLHWDGAQWSRVPSPNIDLGGNFNAVLALGADNVWAVGHSRGSIVQTFIAQYTSSCSPPPTSTPTACPIQFSDVPSDNPFYEYIRCLTCRGIVSGYDDGTFRPNNNITRRQIAKIVSNAAGFTEDPDPQIYEDVDPANPYYTWINRLSRRGYMGGYPCGVSSEEPCVEPDNRPYFRPFNSATRGQISKIVSNAAEFDDPPIGQIFSDVPPDNGFYTWIDRLAIRGIVSGYPCGGEGEPCDDRNRPYLRPNNSVTRGQASKIVANTFYPYCQTP